MANQIISKVDGAAQDGQSAESAQYSYNPKQVTMGLDSGMMMGDPSDSGDDSPTPDHATVVAEARADVAANDAADATTTTANADSTPAAYDWDAPANKANDATTTTASAGSGSEDIIHEFASGWEKTSSDISATTTTAVVSDDKIKFSWETPSASKTTQAFQFSWESSAPSTTTTAAGYSWDAPKAEKPMFSWESSSASTTTTTPALWEPPKSDATDSSDFLKKYESSANSPSKDGVLAEMNKLLGKTTSPLETSPEGIWIQQHAQGHKGRHHANKLISIRLHKTEPKKFF